MRAIVLFASAIVGIGAVLSATEPVLTGFDPGEATLGQEMTLQGSGLSEAVEVRGIDWRGTAVSFPILASDSGSVTVEVPNIRTSWRSDFRVQMIAVTSTGATMTLPPDIAVVEGFASTDDFNSQAFRVTSGSSLAMSEMSGGGLFFYVETGASLTVGGGGGSHLFFVENGGTITFPDSHPNGGIFAGQGALLAGLSDNYSNVSIFPALNASEGVVSPRIYPSPQFEVPTDATAILGKSWAEAVAIHRISPSGIGWEVSGLPQGVNFIGGDDSAVFSGIPAETGVFEVVVTATIEYPGFLASQTREMVLTVIDDGVPIIVMESSYELGSGEEIELTIAASHAPTSFGATGLPPGLSINAETGVISGIATQPGAYSVLLTATSGDQTGEAVVTLLVDQAPLSVTGYSPASGVANDVITVQGTGFSTTEKVLLFDRRNEMVEAEFTVVNDTELDVILPLMDTDRRAHWTARMLVITATEATVTDQQGLNLGNMQIVEAGGSNDGDGGLQLVYLKSGATGFFGGGGSNIFFAETGVTVNYGGGGGDNRVVAAPGVTISGYHYPEHIIAVPPLSLSELDAMLVQYPLPRLLYHPSSGTPTLHGKTGTHATWDFRLTGTGATSDVTVEAIGLPAGFSLSIPGYREIRISGTPQLGGVYEATVLLSNQFGTNPVRFRFDIDDDFMPKFQALGQVQVEVGEAVHIEVDLFNAPEVLQVENLPDGLLFNPFTGEITGVPGSPGFYEFTVVAVNDHGEARLDVQLQVGETDLTITRLPEAATEGTWVDVEGAGFSTATKVLAIDPWRNIIRQTEFEVVSDTLLRFEVPANFHRIRQRGVHLVVITPQAAVVTLSPGFHEVVGIESGAHGKDNIVRDGGRIENGGGGVIAYLESGGELAASGGGYLVFAEADALVELGGGGGGHAVVYATGATVLGSPSAGFEVPSLRYALVEPLIVQQMPALTGPATAQGFLKLPFTYQIQTGHGPSSENLSFGAADLPAGLEVDANSGLIFGRPEAVGSFSAWVEVQNQEGTTGRALKIIVTDPFEEWQKQKFGHLLGGTFNPQANPDVDLYGDGFTNLGRYGFVLDPSQPAHGVEVASVSLVEAPPPVGPMSFSMGGLMLNGSAVLTSQPAERIPQFTYRRLQADGVGHVSNYRVGSLTYVAEVSQDLVDWHSGPDFLEQAGGAVDNQDGSETVTLRPVQTDQQKLFFRVRLVRD